MPTIVQISPGDDVVEASSEDMAPVEEDTVDAVEASSKDVIPVEDDTAAIDVIETTTAEAIQIDLKDAPAEELIEETTVAIDTKLFYDVTTAAPGAEVTTLLAGAGMAQQYRRDLILIFIRIIIIIIILLLLFILLLIPEVLFYHYYY